jgi:hypothetical protein
MNTLLMFCQSIKERRKVTTVADYFLKYSKPAKPEKGYYMLLKETTGCAIGAYWLVKALSCFLVLMRLPAALKHPTTFSGGT